MGKIRPDIEKVLEYLKINKDNINPEKIKCNMLNSFSFIEKTVINDEDILFRGIPLIKNINTDYIKESVYLSYHYLDAILSNHGRFYYEHNLLYNNYNKTGYNILRHCGTIYSIIQIYEIFKTPEVLKTADRGLNYLIRNYLKTNSSEPDLFYILEGSRAKLGGTALALLAMSEYQIATGNNKYEKYMTGFVKQIKSMQQSNGFINSYFKFNENIEVPDKISIYYPGEACYALLKYANAVDDDKMKIIAFETARNGINYLIKKRPYKFYFIKKYFLPGKVPPDAWLQLAIYEYYQYSNDPEYNNYSKKITNYMLSQIRLKEKINLDYIGGFHGNPPHLTPAGARLEGLTAYCKILEKDGNTKELNKILALLKKTSRFTLTSQVNYNNSYFLPVPENSIGAFKESPLSYKIRIDYVQHNVSGLIGLLSLME